MSIATTISRDDGNVPDFFSVYREQSDDLAQITEGVPLCLTGKPAVAVRWRDRMSRGAESVDSSASAPGGGVHSLHGGRLRDG